METNKHTCLNCGAIPIGAYCHDCGQKSDTHRLSLSHLVKHDLVHGIWHFDKGLLYTLRESFLRPGRVALDYINGKRVKYYNIFYLILIVLGINAVTAYYFKAHYNITGEGGPKGLVMHKDRVDVSYYVSNNFKLLLFLVIPFFALGGFISFRKLKLNFAEHFILAGDLLLGGTIWYFFVITSMYSGYNLESLAFDLIVYGFIIMAWLQPVRVYYRAAHKEYTTGGFILRVLLWFLCLALQLYMVLLLIALLTGKTAITFS